MESEIYKILEGPCNEVGDQYFHKGRVLISPLFDEDELYIDDYFICNYVGYSRTEVLLVAEEILKGGPVDITADIFSRTDGSSVPGDCLRKAYSLLLDTKFSGSCDDPNFYKRLLEILCDVYDKLSDKDKGGLPQ